MIRALAVAFALCAGACPAPPPLVTPGQVVTDGDTTFRTREGDAIDVTSARRYGEQQATGVATLRGMSLEDARRSPLVAVAAGRAWQTIERALGDAATARVEVLRRALDELGTAYRGKGMIDDTGHQVKLAELAASRGDMAAAAEKLSEVLAVRLAAYTRAFRGSLE